MSDVRRSIAWSSAQSYLGVALQLASTMVLSRVLTPAEVGTYAVAMVFMALAVNFRDFGIAEYLIQLKQPTESQIRSAFTVNIGLSWLMGLVIFATAQPVARFYGQDEIASVMRIQSLSFVLIPFGAINMAWLRRSLQFKPIFVASVLADICSLAVSVSLALRGHGAISMAWASLAGVVVTVAVSTWYRPAELPRWPGRDRLGEVLRFGGWASGIYVLGQLGRSAPEAVIGKFQGVAGLGMYSRGAGLVQIFRQLVLRAVTPVCLPYFSKSVREEKSVVRAYSHGIAVVTCVAWPFLGLLTIEAFSAIRFVYGQQWMDAVPLAKILCVAAAVEVVHYLAKEALLANGLVKPASQLQFWLQGIQVLGLMAVIPFGLIGACWGLFAAAVAGALLSQRQLGQLVGLRWSDVLKPCRSSLLITALALAPVGVFALAYPADQSNFLIHLLIAGALCALVWVLAVRALGHPLWAEMAQVGATLARRIKPAAPATPPGP